MLYNFYEGDQGIWYVSNDDECYKLQTKEEALKLSGDLNCIEIEKLGIEFKEIH